MRRTNVARSAIRAALAAATATLALGAPCATTFAAPPAPRGAGSFSLATASPGGTYAPTFTGNGMLGVRAPAIGQGYAGGSVPAQSELAGFYAQPPGGVQQRANIPTWSTLSFSDGGQAFSLTAGQVSRWRQSIDFRTGIITTSAVWRAPDGHVTQLAYELLTDRARQFVGLVRLVLIPRWSGTATVTDLIDGAPADLTTQVGKGWTAAARRDWVEVRTQGTNITAALASELTTSRNIRATVTPVAQATAQSVGQRLDFPVNAGRAYVIAKYVGVESSQDTANPVAAAQGQAHAAATTGFDRLVGANDAAWSALWSGRIDLPGSPALATMVNASEFYLWSSTREGVNWSISPAGLSSNGYNGHIFWDAETWMYPSLLALHPELASGINAYRHDRLAAAERHAKQTGYRGARFPWESALDGTEQIPPPVSVNSEGLYEQHITADIALAQWQYYLATGDRRWLAKRGWPVLSKAARFWASRVRRASDGRYHIDGVTGPDEENPAVNDEAYTNAAAATTLNDAAQAARVLRIAAPPSWTAIAAHMVVPVSGGIHPEFAGYRGQLVKQADVTLLQYPWRWPMAASIAQNDLDYYVPRTDPSGPSMSDAVNEIDSSALGTPGCSAYVYTRRSFEPFIRDAFDQFSETRTGGAFTFMTGIGGFLQEFLYGYSGLRLDANAVRLDPSLTRQLPAVVLRGLTWRGRRFEVAIGLRRTRVTLLHGAPLPIQTPRGRRTVTRRRPLTIATRRPDLAATADLIRCGRATATSAQPGAPALAAVDGSAATDWQPAALPATLTVSAGGPARVVKRATLVWGQQWPPPPAPNVHPPPGPVITLRATSYQLLTSLDGRSWRPAATVTNPSGTTDTVRFAPRRARFVRITIAAARTTLPPMLEELSAG
jgi:trehalose/maltose hydrolase-like predicted phosphorylase